MKIWVLDWIEAIRDNCYEIANGSTPYFDKKKALTEANIMANDFKERLDFSEGDITTFDENEEITISVSQEDSYDYAEFIITEKEIIN